MSKPAQQEQPFQYGGQAVIEGVMMRSPRYFSIAVRRQANQEIVILTEPLAGVFAVNKWLKVPFVRGALALVDAMRLGVRALMWSANVALEDAVASDAEKSGKPPAKLSEYAVQGTMALSLALGVTIFFILPSLLAGGLHHQAASHLAYKHTIWLNVKEGLIRLAIFISYLSAISFTKDVRRLFGYHGAEHKAINAFEEGQPLSVEGASRGSRIHVRCGTSFLLIVVLGSGVIYSFFGWPAWYLRIAIRILLLPVIAGIAYEILKLAGSHKHNKFFLTLLAPGLWSQRITTREPSEDQIEVALAALNAVIAAEEQHQTEAEPADLVTM